MNFNTYKALLKICLGKLWFEGKPILSSKFDCDWNNLDEPRKACGECRVCKYLEFLDWANTMGKPEGSTVDYSQFIDKYFKVRKNILIQMNEAEVFEDLQNSGLTPCFPKESKKIEKLDVINSKL